MSRRELREQIFKFIFRAEFNEPEEMAEQKVLYLTDDELKLDEKDANYISEKSEKILSKLSELDEMIDDEALGWTTSRMSKVDLTILRLAVYEIRFDEDVPTGVAINEAVELAKKYGQEESAGFVNGVLAKFA